MDSLTETQKTALAELDNFLTISNDEDGILLWMNDTFNWATSDAITVLPAEIEELHKLFSRYGFCGAAYWAGKKEKMRSAFRDINRFIDFVTHEEKLRVDEPSSNKRASLALVYTLGKEGGA